MEREAQCQCGAVKLIATGDPAGVVACHCLACQRRTGSVFGVGAYFLAGQVTIAGLTREYVRPTDAGNTFHTHFCLTCGTTTHWQTSRHPGQVGIAVGAFAEPSFPTPVRSVWEQSRHGWLDLPATWQHVAQGRVG